MYTLASVYVYVHTLRYIVCTRAHMHTGRACRAHVHTGLNGRCLYSDCLYYDCIVTASTMTAFGKSSIQLSHILPDCLTNKYTRTRTRTHTYFLTPDNLQELSVSKNSSTKLRKLFFQKRFEMQKSNSSVVLYPEDSHMPYMPHMLHMPHICRVAAFAAASTNFEQVVDSLALSLSHVCTYPTRWPSLPRQ